MGRRAKSPFEDNSVINGLLEWMDAPEGQRSIEALDLVFDALEHAGVDARQRKIVWADGKRLSIEQSAERIHAEHPATSSKLTCWVGWKAVRRHPTPSANSRNSTGSSNRGSTTMSARHGPPESNRELGTLEEGAMKSKSENPAEVAVLPYIRRDNAGNVMPSRTVVTVEVVPRG